MIPTASTRTVDWRIGPFLVRAIFCAQVPGQWEALYPTANISHERRECGDFHVRLFIAPTPEWAADPAIIRQFPKSQLTRGKEGIHFSHARFRGTVEKQRHAYEGRFEVAENDLISLYLLLQTVVSWCCLEENGVMLHTSGVVKDHRLYLFSGASGSGKTTIAAELSDGGTPFCVEAACLRKYHEGRWHAFPTPFSDFDGDVRLIASQEIHAIIFIEQASRHDASPLSPSQCAFLTMKNAIFFFDDTALKRRLLEVASDIAESTRAFALKFEKNSEFWRIIMPMATSA